ncbi:MAG TPA: O-antigen ligase family protein [Verrucomicrobiae bacterium]|jgi:O-antigen ligase
MKPKQNSGPREYQYALIFGIFLGLALWKFGNPIILDSKITTPATLLDFWNDAWPVHWAKYFFLPLAALGAVLIFQKKNLQPPNRRLWLLPLLWFGWQLVSATQTISAVLTVATLWQFFGCVSCYFLGAFLFTDKRALQLLLVGLLLAFTFCLVRGVIQKNYEFPQNHQMLVEGERSGWTNYPPETITEMKRENIIVTTNGVDVANPVIVAKFAKGRVNGTLVYPNALAGLILLLLPVALVLAFSATRKLRPFIRWTVIVLTISLGGSVFFWTGSKLGWLIGIGLSGLFLLRLEWSKKLKILAVAAILILGGGIFAVRFHTYFAAGATSVGARFDYWRAAGQTTVQNPVFGSGPGTFQLTYAAIKPPGAEMARLTHNDYLEQFCDSGVVGGAAYSLWIILALVIIGRKLWRSRDIFRFAIFGGLSAWFAQGLGEFGLYIPALAWTAFTLLGGLSRMEPAE